MTRRFLDADLQINREVLTLIGQPLSAFDFGVVGRRSRCPAFLVLGVSFGSLEQRELLWLSSDRRMVLRILD